MKSNKYWEERFAQLEKLSNDYAKKTFRDVEKVFNKALREVERDIEGWYGRLANNNKITMQEAKKLLRDSELSEFKWDVLQYIKNGEENAINKKWIKELENASAKFHINELEALKIRIQQQAEVAFKNELDEIDKMVRKVFGESYYRSIFEIQKGFNVGFSVRNIDQRKLDKLIVKPWALDGKNFSDRIWQQKSQLISELHNQLSINCILGRSPDKAIKMISNRFNVTKRQAERLIITEESYFHSISQKEVFQELGIEKFKVVATLDSSTSEICQDMDGQIFDMKDYEVGVTANPFHVGCRSTTIPYFEDNWGERIARGYDGETYYVPNTMKYKEWKEKYL